jgi:hypothetical protein
MTMTDHKRDATFHPGSTPDHPLPVRTPMEALAQHGQPPPDDPPDRMHYDSPGPAPWATAAERGRRTLPTVGWVALIIAAASLVFGSMAVMSLTGNDVAPSPVVRTVTVTTTGTCEKRLVGSYGLVATITATNGTRENQSGQVWVQWPVTGETVQRFVKPVTLTPGEAVEFPVNQDIPAERWYRTGMCTYGWEPTVKPNGMAPVGFSIDWGSPKTTPPNKRVIEVVDKIKPTAWRVSAAVKWLDRYTASDMRLVARCSGKAYRCVTVRQGRVNGPVGWSQGATITIDTGKANSAKFRPWYRLDKNRTWLLVHELGHQHGLDHAGSGNLMSEHVNRYRMTLTSGQRATLRKR